MKLKRKLPPGRTIDQIRNHYLVEKSIADKLKASTREQRKEIYSSMYDELFAKVPDHPRLKRRRDENLIRSSNAFKMIMVGRFLTPSTDFVEFAAGDCEFSREVCKHVRSVKAIDIGDQRENPSSWPDNFQLIVYDGYNLLFPENSVDVVFSDQFLEHLHPEDTEAHLKLVHKMLRPGGKYILHTPHAFSGPHEISGFFSDTPEGFHLKEWTFCEIGQLLESCGYTGLHSHWVARQTNARLPFSCFSIAEKIFSTVPTSFRRRASRFLLPSVCMVAVK